MNFLFYYEKMCKQLLPIVIVALFPVSVETVSASNDSSYVLNLELQNHSSQSVALGYYYGNKTKFKDTILLNPAGAAGYSDIDHEGIYFIRFSDSSAYEFMITNAGHYRILYLEGVILCKGNGSSEAFDQYLKRTEPLFHSIDSLKNSLEDPGNYANTTSTQQKIREYKSTINCLTEELANRHEGNLLGSYAKAMLPVLTLSPVTDENSMVSDSAGLLIKLYQFRNHYFDNINFEDPGLIYTPVLEDRITNYLDHLVDNTADSICNAVNMLMTISGQTEVNRFISTLLLQKYRNQRHRNPGEQVYSFLLRNYFLAGKTPWVSENDLRLLTTELSRMQLVSEGAVAPEIELPDMIGRKCSLHSVEVKFTILVFWDLACPSCKQVMEDFKDLMRRYYYIDAQVFTVYTGTDRESWKTWNIKRLPATWINTYQNPLQPVSTRYNITTVPAIFILDSKKTIIRKNITLPELDEFFLRL